MKTPFACSSCGAQFVMSKRWHEAEKLPMQCPDCGQFNSVFVEKPLAETLKKIIVSGKLVLINKPGKISPEEKKISENQAG